MPLMRPTSVQARGGILLFLAITFGVTRPALACSQSDISIKQADWHYFDNNKFASFVGELSNDCLNAAKIELQIVFRDELNKVVEVNEFYPAESRRIPGKSLYAFHGYTAVHAPVSQMEVHVIGVE